MIVFLLSLLFMNNAEETAPPQESPAKIIYVGDPMCSWCYGVSKELRAVKEHFEGRLEFETVLGGLRPYNKQTMVELQDFLTEHWEHVNQASGMEFRYEILKSPNITYDTEPACRAVVVARDMAPEKAFDFFKLVQKEFYYNNKNLHLPESYSAALSELGMDIGEFWVKFSSQDYYEKVKVDFARAEQLGVRSFPTVLLQRQGVIESIANGFATSEEMIAEIESFLQDE